MKVLIIGNFDSMYLYQFVKQVLALKPAEYYFFHSGSKIKEEYLNFYIDFAKSITYEKTHRFFNYSLMNLIKEMDHVDIVLIHFIKIDYYIPLLLNKKSISKINLCMWGSDLLRLNKKKKYLMRKLLLLSDFILLSVKEQEEYICRTFGADLKSRFGYINFGSPIIDQIKYCKKIYKKSYLKEKMGFPNSKFVIACGYNGSKFQQHEKILEVLSMLPKNIKDKIFIHLPMGYGLANDYKEKILYKMKLLGIEYYLDEHFYNELETAMLRLATDIFIHGQSTDAFSSSVLEYLYADTVLINGKWLNYTPLKENEVFYIEFDKFDDLKDIVTIVMSNYKFYLDMIENSNESIYELKSWSTQKKIWLKYLEEIEK